MNFQGIGSDIIEVERIKKTIERQKKAFIEKIFTSPEIAYAEQFKDPYIRFAGRFAAKEAVVKALGLGFGSKISWLDITITNDNTGKPQVIFSKKITKEFNNPKILLSISHCHKYAMAIALLLEEH